MMLWLSSSFFKRALYVIKSSWDCSVLIACTTGLLLVDVFWLPPLALLVECCLARFRFGVPFESSGDEEFEIDSYFMDHSDSLSRTGMYRSPPSGRYRVRDRCVCIRWEPPWCWKFMNWNSGVEVRNWNHTNSNNKKTYRFWRHWYEFFDSLRHFAS